jgi:hypothetical protein
MELTNLLSDKKFAILERWLAHVLESLPYGSSNFIKTHNNRFTNPMGFTFKNELETIFDGLMGGAAIEDLSAPLDSIIRIRAVQDLLPSQALAFVFSLKRVVRDVLGSRSTALAGELAEFDSTIDSMALFSFDIYMKCREKIYELKANETKNLTYRLLQRANLISEVPEE